METGSTNQTSINICWGCGCVWRPGTLALPGTSSTHSQRRVCWRLALFWNYVYNCPHASLKNNEWKINTWFAIIRTYTIKNVVRSFYYHTCVDAIKVNCKYCCDRSTQTITCTDRYTMFTIPFVVCACYRSCLPMQYYFNLQHLAMYRCIALYTRRRNLTLHF